MNELYQKALNGTLMSVQNSTPLTAVFTNKTEIPISIVWVNYSGMLADSWSIAPGKSLTVNTYDQVAFIARNQLSGGFLCALVTHAKDAKGGKLTIPISCDLLVPPNDIGDFPQPSQDTLIPPDSPLVMVACGRLPNGNFITREQYWARQPDSFSLAPHEKKTVTITTTRGLQKTSSNTEKIEASLDVHANAGWGPISAGISSSLSANSTTFQQVTVTEETAVYESKIFDSKSDNPAVFLIWQLVDLVTIYKGQVPQATMSMGEPPSLFSKPFNPLALEAKTRGAAIRQDLPRPSAIQAASSPRPRKVAAKPRARRK